MLRRYTPVLISTLAYITAGVLFGICWYTATGRVDMPPWVLIALVLVSGLIGEVVERALEARQARRTRPETPARHRKADA
ncbi:hypothetical protein AB0454_22595 [Streptomyces sp. NPDC093509]|uniref:hypothetical protein n=1 Tax=Streptomyces sp. NPDC093509 TaxID=3154982 RepID=UPI0034501AFB